MSALEPDELYTLRAQYWLGHYGLALEEAKGIMRRPMSAELKLEREEFVGRCQLALGDYGKVIATGSSSGAAPVLVALGLKAQLEQYLARNKVTIMDDDGTVQSIVQQLQSLLVGGDMTSPSVALIAAQAFNMVGKKKEAFATGITQGITIEHVSFCLQMYLSMDRLDLAKQQLQRMKHMDEDSVLAQLGSVHIAIATGSSMAKDAIHTLSQLSEQYGPSCFLLNLLACAYLITGDYVQAEAKLEQIRMELGITNNVDTLVNLLVCYQYQQKDTSALVSELTSSYPNHFLSHGLEMVEGAFEREAIKYKV